MRDHRICRFSAKFYPRTTIPLCMYRKIDQILVTPPPPPRRGRAVLLWSCRSPRWNASAAWSHARAHRKAAPGPSSLALPIHRKIVSHIFARRRGKLKQIWKATAKQTSHRYKKHGMQSATGTYGKPNQHHGSTLMVAIACEAQRHFSYVRVAGGSLM